jgi:hypothetical protein
MINKHSSSSNKHKEHRKCSPQKVPIDIELSPEIDICVNKPHIRIKNFKCQSNCKSETESKSKSKCKCKSKKHKHKCKSKHKHKCKSKKHKCKSKKHKSYSYYYDYHGGSDHVIF